jgi:hypothetical protein
VSKFLSWKGTSLKINNINDEGSYLINILKEEGIHLREDSNRFILENQSNYFIFEDKFINQCKNLLQMITKYSEKKYLDNIKVYLPDSETFGIVQTQVHDVKKYEKVIENNIIDGDIREFNISINVLVKVLDNSNESRVFLDILVLFALATKSSYDAEALRAEFRVENSIYKIEMNIKNPKPIHLYPLYNWIINDEEYEESYNVKLHIVRQVIVIKKNINDVEGILEDSKLAYKRIISKKTNDYFEQLNQLKDDFLILSNNEKNALRTLNLTFFAWIGYLGIELFNIISKYTGDDIISYLLCSKGVKKAIVILMFIIALVFIFVSYVIEIKSLEKTYNVIKNIYKDKILFEVDSDEENKFEKTINKPEVGKLQKFIFTAIIITLFVRLFLALP